MKKCCKYVGIIIMVMMIGLFLGCSNPADGGDDDLPVETIRWELDDEGFTQFYTNDSQYYTYGFWGTLANINDEAPDVFEMDCKKISGADNYGYGMIFGAEDTDNFYYILFTTGGRYTIRKRIGPSDNGIYTTIQDWTGPSSYWKTGYKTVNRIRVNRIGDDFYSVYVNDKIIENFEDATISGDLIGVYLGVGDAEDEDFPNKPVDVRFRQVR